MKIHIITVGSPKLAYAKLGWDEYCKRLSHYHQLRVTHIADKHNDANHIQTAIGNSYSIGLVIKGAEFTSPNLALFLEKRALSGQEVCFIIGGPDGIPPEIIASLDHAWSYGGLTYPHDLAMVMLVESLYRASTISAGLPYHH
jgi:23S rRNA (pseudouridine1915-N3)-methyltransferase